MSRPAPRFLLLGCLLATLPAIAQQASIRAKAGQRTPPAESSTRADDVALSLGGAAGLLRMRSAPVGAAGSFRLGLHTEMFSGSSFLVEDDEHRRFIGTLKLAGTLTSWLEAYLFAQSASNENTARNPEAGGDVILALGDFGLGAKTRFGGRVLSGGPETNIRFLNSVGGTTPEWSATNWYLGGVATIDPRDSGLPARAHLNAGYRWDRSRELCPTDGACSDERFGEPVERIIEEFGQGLNRSRFEVALGADVPLSLGQKLRVWPMLEYHLDIASGDVDAGYADTCEISRQRAAQGQDDGFRNICGLGRDSQSILIGIRVRPLPGLFADLGVDWGLASPGAEYGPSPATPPWNLILGVSYAHDPPTAPTLARAPTGGALAPPIGRVRGIVLDAHNGDPVDGAVVVFTGRNLTGLSTDPDGGFLSYDFPAGPLAISVRHASYETAKANVVIVVGKDLPLEVRLKPAPGVAPAAHSAATTFSGRVTDSAGAPVPATVRLQGAENREFAADERGAFSADLPPGDYVARFEAASFLAKEQGFQIEPGRAQTLEVVLSRRPNVPRVQISGNRIVLKGKVHFGSRNARLRPDSSQILDEVADLLLAHPEITRVRIEGHTDNRGSKRANQKLSQERADAVRGHLLQRGVASERVHGVGYGASRPLVPNLGERNREKNRRVELRIVN